MSLHIAPEETINPEEFAALREKYSAYAQAQGLDADSARTPLGIFIRDEAGEIVGGLYGGYSGSWMFIDTLWLHERLRGQGYGTKLMTAIEQAAAARGITKTILGTGSFQAPEFYRKLGYSYALSLEKLVRDVDNYMMKKENIARIPDFKSDLVVECPPKPEDADFLNKALGAYNDSKVGALTTQPVLVSLRAADGTMVGGAAGGILDQTAQLALVWVDEGLRGRGYGIRLLHAFNAALARRGVRRAIGQAVGEQQLAFARKGGYRSVMQIEDYPAGYTSHYLMKDDFSAT